MANTSAGLLMYRFKEGELQVFLVHPGGPYFAEKDAGAWSIPKGLVEKDENVLTAARREFAEETGFAPQPPFIELGTVRQKSGKTVQAWAFAGDANPAALKSNTFTIEWPPRSGERKEFPEVDRAAWFPLAEALKRIHPAQRQLLLNLQSRIAVGQ